MLSDETADSARLVPSQGKELQGMHGFPIFSPMQVAGPHLAKLRYLALVTGLGVAAFCFSIFFFCPRFALWRGLPLDYLGPALRNPEINRAKDVLTQLEHPFAKIENTSNFVIQWRLLFPLIGHALHLPVMLYMAIPHVGCITTLAFVAHLIFRETQRWDWAFMGSALIATGSWFFVSTGWLTYADSWYLLGLLIVSFSNSRAAIVIACLLEPFIDERFILSLPLAIAVRIVVFNQLHPSQRKQLVLDLAIVATLCVPYVVMRLLLLRGSDSASSAYVQGRLSELSQHVPWTRYALGVWMGMRGAWLLVIAAIWWLCREKRWAAVGILAGAVVLSIATGLVIAADIGRSMSAPFPAAILGLILLADHRPQWLRYGLPILLAFNLMMPAANVITVFTEPIFYLYTEIDRYNNPPPEVNPLAYVSNGNLLVNANKFQDARHLFDQALILDSRCVEALLGRAVTYLRMQDLPAAAADADAAAKISPDLPDVLYVRGVILMTRGQKSAAADLFQSALDRAPADWAQRAQCQSLVAQLRPPPPPVPNLGGIDFHL